MSEGSRGYILYTCTFKSRCGKIGKSIPQKAQRKHMH